MSRFASDEQRMQFERGAMMMLTRWDILQLVLQHEMAGDDTVDMVDELVQNLVTWLQDDGTEEEAHEELTVGEVERYITEVLTEDMGIDIEHPSIAQIARDLLQMKAECANGNYATVEQLATDAIERIQQQQPQQQQQHNVYQVDFAAEEQASRDARLRAAAHRMASLLSDSDEEDGDAAMDDDDDDDDGWTTVGRSNERPGDGRQGEKEEMQDD